MDRASLEPGRIPSLHELTPLDQVGSRDEAYLLQFDRTLRQPFRSKIAYVRWAVRALLESPIVQQFSGFPGNPAASSERCLLCPPFFRVGATRFCRAVQMRPSGPAACMEFAAYPTPASGERLRLREAGERRHQETRLRARQPQPNRGLVPTRYSRFEQRRFYAENCRELAWSYYAESGAQVGSIDQYSEIDATAGSVSAIASNSMGAAFRTKTGTVAAEIIAKRVSHPTSVWSQ